MDYVLNVANLSKKYNGVQALYNVNFNLKRGEIHGIIGANGSGKSTFMNILFGSKHIKETGGYEGDIFINNKKVDIKNSYDAIMNGIGMVHQELSLLGELSVSSNIKINRENITEMTKIFRDFALVNINKNEEDAKSSLSKIGIDINPGIRVKTMSTGFKQFVEIAREIDKENLEILILDEPTSSLNIEETEILLNNLKNIAEDGVSIIFISHRLEEVARICHRVTILKDGKVTKVYNREDFSINKMANDMIGKEIIQVLRHEKKLLKKDILSFDNVEVHYGYNSYKNIYLDIKEGEILGITGLAGHGQEIFGYGLMGIYNMNGKIFYNGEKMIPGNTDPIIKKGVYLLPDDRKEMGLLLNKGVWENLVFECYDRQDKFIKYPKFKNLSPLNHRFIRKYSNYIIDKLNIKVKDIYQKTGELSGGNQQKVCIGRAITMMPNILFIGEPTRGIDVYSKEIILDILLKLNEERNTTIIISSGEISELKRVCDRIAIMYENRVFKIFNGNFETEAFNLALSGRSLNAE